MKLFRYGNTRYITVENKRVAEMKSVENLTDYLII